jgi:hypothetical protein
MGAILEELSTSEKQNIFADMAGQTINFWLYENDLPVVSNLPQRWAAGATERRTSREVRLVPLSDIERRYAP